MTMRSLMMRILMARVWMIVESILTTTMRILMRMNTNSPVPASSLPPSTRARCASILPIQRIIVARAETICQKKRFSQRFAKRGNLPEKEGFSKVFSKRGKEILFGMTHPASSISCNASQKWQEVLFSHVELAATDKMLKLLSWRLPNIFSSIYTRPG